MEEQQGFRTSFRGFNREDVMAYVDSLQADFSEREAGLREGLTEANACLVALTEENEQLKADVEEVNQELERVRTEAFDHFEQMNAELLTLQKENDRLNEQAAKNSAIATDNVARASGLLAAIEELRACGADFLAASGRTGEECLDEIDAVAEALEQALEQIHAKVGAARSDLVTRRDAAGLRLTELEKSLKADVPSASATAEVLASPAAERNEKPTATADEPAAPVDEQPQKPTAKPVTPTARMTAQPERPRDGWRRFFDGLLG